MRRLLSIFVVLLVLVSCEEVQVELTKTYEGEYFTIQYPDDANIIKTDNGYYGIRIDNPYDIDIKAYVDKDTKLGEADRIKKRFGISCNDIEYAYKTNIGKLEAIISKHRNFDEVDFLIPVDGAIIELNVGKYKSDSLADKIVQTFELTKLDFFKIFNKKPVNQNINDSKITYEGTYFTIQYPKDVYIGDPWIIKYGNGICLSDIPYSIAIWVIIDNKVKLGSIDEVKKSMYFDYVNVTNIGELKAIIGKFSRGHEVERAERYFLIPIDNAIVFISVRNYEPNSRTEKILQSFKLTKPDYFKDIEKIIYGKETGVVYDSVGFGFVIPEGCEIDYYEQYDTWFVNGTDNEFKEIEIWIKTEESDETAEKKANDMIEKLTNVKEQPTLIEFEMKGIKFWKFSYAYLEGEEQSYVVAKGAKYITTIGCYPNRKNAKKVLDKILETLVLK